MRRAVLAAAIMGLASSSPAAWAASSISVMGAWSRVTPTADSSGVVYLTVRNAGTPDILVAASTPIAKIAEFHQSKTTDGVTAMDPVQALPVSEGKPLSFAPNGYHIMLMGLSHSLVAGTHFPLTLIFARAGAVTTEVTVEPMSYVPPADTMDDMKM